MPALTRGLRPRVTRAARQLLERSPRWYPRYQLRRFGPAMSPLLPTTRLVISGAQGSGNTYVREAILLANPGIQIASHAHSWTEVANAVRRGIPTVFLAREPVDACASRLARWERHTTPAWVLDDYARLYERVRPFVDGIVVVDFQTAVADVGGLVRSVNAKFGSDFVPFDDAARAAEVLEHLQSMAAAKHGSRAAARGAGPSDERDQAKLRLREALQAADLAPRLARCERAYRALVAG